MPMLNNNLTVYLQMNNQTTIVLSFSDIESITGEKLSQKARTTIQYWANASNKSYSKYWMNAGYIVNSPTDVIKAQKVTFIKNNAVIVKQISNTMKKNKTTSNTTPSNPPLLDSSSNPYILDYIQGTKIPALTDKNRMFIEAVVHLDSNYNKDDDISAGPKKKYPGSTAYWFDQMSKTNNYELCLKKAIIAIDRTNSTRLEATVNGRDEMYNIVYAACKDVNSLKAELSKPFLQTTDKTKHLIGLMSIELPAKGKTGTRSNLSFASKFCAYASLYLGCGDLYSKYDDVVSNHLNQYAFHYLGAKLSKGKIKYYSEKKKKLPTNTQLNYVLQIYEEYCKCIEEIIANLASNHVFPTNNNITRSELDHIIWYGFKG